jgi:metallo-beta-lactamase family protein
MQVSVKFLGGTGTVTGSRFLLDIGDFRLLFDCGLFQGLKELRLRNWDIFPVDPSSIKAVVISHAHIDHTGYLPKLVSEGFNGPIYCTEPTAALMGIMLLDSAKLQEEEAAYSAVKGYSKHADPQPLYATADAQAVFPLIQAFPLNQTISIHPTVEIVFRDAGHLLGAAITELFIKGTSQKKLVFSGDLGRSHDAIMNKPHAINEANTLFIESTYGNRDNPSTDPENELATIVNDTLHAKGVLLIPAFAVGRAQELLYYLRKLIRENKIPDVPVYLDSPMAISATYLYANFQKYHKIKFNPHEFAQELDTNMLVFVKSAIHSKSLNDIKANAIIISSSGMMTSGRILHHLYHHLPRKQDTLLISGYQAEGTRGRKIVEGSSTIRIFGEDVPVKCRVKNMTSLSGHADKAELFEWMKQFSKPPEKVFTVHGEGEDLKKYGDHIREDLKWNVIQPNYLEKIILFDDF